MKTIRGAAFESNSSSSHSIVVSDTKQLLDTITPDKNGVIVLWGLGVIQHQKLTTAIEKAQYLAGHFVHPYYGEGSNGRVEFDRRKEMFESALKRHTGATEISYTDNVEECSFDGNGSLNDWHIENNLNSEEDFINFLFNPDSALIIDY